MSKTIISFNFSVSKKSKLIGYDEPYQIMPSTVNYIKDSDIEKYEGINNPDILIHMNYITRVFSSKALENGSSVRYSLRQYGKLAKKIGTNRILIHMPKSLQEWNNFILGYKIIHDELLSKGFEIHFEITAWSKDLLEHFGKDSDKVQVTKQYYDVLLDASKSYNDEKNVFIVIDTAHMFANGCNEEDMIAVIKHYEDKIEYLHWNGNVRPMYTNDSHVPIFSKKSLMGYEKISEYVASLGVVCICEITKDGEKYTKWKEYADRYGFDLVSENEMLVC